MSNDNDGRQAFAEALAQVERDGTAAFAVTPVFGDDDETAEGARVFVLRRDAEGDAVLHFVAGPFFTAAYAANEVIDAHEAPDSVRELRFLPTRCDERWFSEQVQVLINRLTNAAGGASAMPDYLNAATRSAGAEAVFPVSFIGKPH